MPKSAYHPRAFLALKKNVRPGLANRTKIVSSLQEIPLSAKALAQNTGLSYRSILHHLHLLEAEHILVHDDSRPYIWRLTGAGQQTLFRE